MTAVDSGAGVEGRLAALLASDPDLLADPYPLYAELRERAPVCDLGTVAAIPLGRASLPGSVLPTRRLVRSHTSKQAPERPPAPAYLVLLRVEIARFTRCRRLATKATTRLCCSDPHLAVDSR